MQMQQSQLIRLIVLGVAVVLEGIVLLSAVLQVQLLPLPDTLYPSVVSVAVFVLPSLVGLLARRLEAALLLAALPFWVLGVVYLAVRSPVWYLDLVQIGVLVERVASTTILLFLVSLLGWLLQRVLRGNAVSAVKVR
jgi:hypothetical protein